MTGEKRKTRNTCRQYDQLHVSPQVVGHSTTTLHTRAMDLVCKRQKSTSATFGCSVPCPNYDIGCDSIALCSSDCLELLYLHLLNLVNIRLHSWMIIWLSALTITWHHSAWKETNFTTHFCTPQPTSKQFCTPVTNICSWHWTKAHATLMNPFTLTASCINPLAIRIGEEWERALLLVVTHAQKCCSSSSCIRRCRNCKRRLSSSKYGAM